MHVCMYMCMYACMYAYLNYVTRDSGQAQGKYIKTTLVVLTMGRKWAFFIFPFELL